MTDFYRIIEQWTEDDLLNLSPQENELYEYKRSATPKDDLINKIGKAASAFWNAGGGIFVAGIDGNGKIDGGIPKNYFGRQEPRDWVDQAVAKVQPAGHYTVKIIEPIGEQSAIKENCVVLAIGFGMSSMAPHMAPDNKYYIRLGAHSEPAGHFLVEALRARRGFQSPQLRCMLQQHRKSSSVVEIAIISITDAPALDITIDFDPLPEYLAKLGYQFPITISLIDRSTPFHFIATHVFYSMGSMSGHFQETEFNISLTYHDILGNRYTMTQKLSTQENFISYPNPTENEAEKIVKAIDELTRKVSDINNKIKR